MKITVPVKKRRIEHTRRVYFFWLCYSTTKFIPLHVLFTEYSTSSTSKTKTWVFPIFKNCIYPPVRWNWNGDGQKRALDSVCTVKPPCPMTAVFQSIKWSRKDICNEFLVFLFTSLNLFFAIPFIMLLKIPGYAYLVNYFPIQYNIF